ncbi:unnamed protein product [Boreogadus saida]
MKHTRQQHRLPQGSRDLRYTPPHHGAGRSPLGVCQGAVGLLLLLLQLGRGQREPPPLHRRWTGQPSPSWTRSPATSGPRGEAPRAMLGVNVTLLKSPQPSGRLAPGLLEDQEPGGEHGLWDREPFAVPIRPEGLQRQDHSQQPPILRITWRLSRTQGADVSGEIAQT